SCPVGETVPGGTEGILVVVLFVAGEGSAWEGLLWEHAVILHSGEHGGTTRVRTIRCAANSVFGSRAVFASYRTRGFDHSLVCSHASDRNGRGSRFLGRDRKFGLRRTCRSWSQHYSLRFTANELA